MALMQRRSVLAAGALLLPQRAIAQSRRTLATGDILRGRFAQERFLHGFDKPLHATGDFVLVAGRGLIWRGEMPFAMLTVITPSGLVQQVDGHETMRLPAARVPFLSRLYDMFSASLAGNWSLLENQFSVAHSGDDRAWTVTLTPKFDGNAASLPIRTVELKGAAFLDEARIDKPDGDWDHLLFQNQSIGGAPLAAADQALLTQGTR